MLKNVQCFDYSPSEIHVIIMHHTDLTKIINEMNSYMSIGSTCKVVFHRITSMIVVRFISGQLKIIILKILTGHYVILINSVFERLCRGYSFNAEKKKLDYSHMVVSGCLHINWYKYTFEIVAFMYHLKFENQSLNVVWVPSNVHVFRQLRTDAMALGDVCEGPT